MTIRKKAPAKAKTKAIKAPPSDEDPRFAELLDELRKDRTFAPIVRDYFARKADGGRAFGSNALKVNDKLFAMVTRGHLVVKLPKDRVATLVAAGEADFFDPGHGRKMKEWASIVSDSLSWEALVREAHAFVGQLSAKPRASRT